MGSLIPYAAQIAAINEQVKGDVYSANPVNAGYTDNPFGYEQSPAVMQVAYPNYSLNATSPTTPPEYSAFGYNTVGSAPANNSELSVTDLLSMISGMQNGSITQAQMPVNLLGALDVAGRQVANAYGTVPPGEQQAAAAVEEQVATPAAATVPQKSDDWYIRNNIAKESEIVRAENASNRAIPRSASRDEVFAYINGYM
jgi:hypothetical protein